ncbi:MAG TPA: hypothetical protein VF290_24995 [Pyrinomonadaceae bacterium]
MLAIEATLTGGIGKVVPGGAPEMTGVLELVVVSVALQPANKQHNASMSNGRFFGVRCPGTALVQGESSAKAPHSKEAPNLRLFVILIMLRFFLGQRFTGNTILPFHPLAEIDKLTTLSTEGTKGIFFPLDWLTAGWAFHESLKPRTGPPRIKEMRVA